MFRRMHPTAHPGDHQDDTARLILLSAQEDPDAFRKLYDQEGPRLYAVALRITRQPSLASDAVHDAMLQVWRNASRFDPERGNARAWLLSLVRYRALDMLARTRREIPGVKLPEQMDPDPGPLDNLLATTDGEALHRCLLEIDADRRGWVMMAFIDGFTHSEVAARVGSPLGTVKSGIRRALLALRACLTGESA